MINPQAALKCASSPRTNALSTKPRLPLAALAGDATRNHPTNNVNSNVSTIWLLAAAHPVMGKCLKLSLLVKINT